MSICSTAGSTTATSWLSSRVAAACTRCGSEASSGLFPQGVSASCSLLVPLAAGGETIGVLCLARPKGQPFADEQRALARGVGDQLSVAIRNARYFEATQQTAALAERHRIARDLHDSVSQSLFSLTLHTDGGERRGWLRLEAVSGRLGESVEGVPERTRRWSHSPTPTGRFASA